jgi:VanZ family protein
MLLPLLASTLIVFGSPYVGELRAALQSTLPGHYRLVVASIVAASAAVALVSAAVRLRRVQRDPTTSAPPGGLSIRGRYLLIAAAVASGAGYARAVSTGDPEVDLVEAFHFVEYGLVAYLFSRAWRGHPDVAGVLLAACAGVAVGVADEWVQWLVPGRVGEVHDVALNAVAVGCGVMISVAVHPPLSLSLPRRRASRTLVGAAVSGVLVAVAGFVDQVHLGHEIQDREAGTFRSRYNARALAAAAANRAARWKLSPPPVRGFAREDHYLSESEWHVARRNTASETGDARTAWGENAILERFYAPALDRLGRWSIEQRMRTEHSALRAKPGTYVSDAAPYPIYVVSRAVFWLSVLLVISGVVWICAHDASSARPAPV